MDIIDVLIVNDDPIEYACDDCLQLRLSLNIRGDYAFNTGTD